MIKFVRTDSDNTDFLELIRSLDAYLNRLNGTEQEFYAQYNKVDKIRHVIVAYDQDTAISCGAIKEYSSGIFEVKRMYTTPEHRGKGVATGVLRQLEDWTKELSGTKCILETGKKMKDAVTLYEKNQYRVTANYGQYTGIEDSICFAKELS